jgi:hypothetical protein
MKESHSHERGIVSERREFLAAAATSLLLLPIDSSSQGVDSMEPAQSPGPGNTSSASLISKTAATFLSALTAGRKAKAVLSFDDAQRLDWHYIPKKRKGLPYKEMDPAERHLAGSLLAVALGPRGLVKAHTIMSLDAILAEIEQGKGPVRDPDLYYFTLLGDPASPGPWGLSVEGHHVSLNYTLLGGRIASTPSFFGANPAEVRLGSRKGLRTLAAEEDLARALLATLDDKQRAEAVISNDAPAEIISANSKKTGPLKPAGIQAARLSQKQQSLLVGLFEEYASSMPADVAADRMQRVRSGGVGNVSFAWAGGMSPGQPHYYRVQGPAFLIEYDNTQNDANHIHTVWRDFDGDFGADLLAMHYKEHH